MKVSEIIKQQAMSQFNQKRQEVIKKTIHSNKRVNESYFQDILRLYIKN
jgi:hypothetical protein